jgi:hypothetical protein
MARPIRTTLVVDVPFSLAIALTEQRLRGMSAREGALPLRVRLFGPRVAYAPTRMVAVATRIERDASDGSRRHEALRVELRAQAGWPVPVFQMLLTARPFNGRTRLQLHTCYEAPSGLGGRALDAVWGRWVAGWTLREFLEKLREGLLDEWTERKSRYPSIAALNARGRQPPGRSSAS